MEYFKMLEDWKWAIILPSVEKRKWRNNPLNDRGTYLKFHAWVYTGAYHKTKSQFVSSNEITGYWVKKNHHALVKNKFIRLIKFISLAKQHGQWPYITSDFAHNEIILKIQNVLFRTMSTFPSVNITVCIINAFTCKDAQHYLKV